MNIAILFFGQLRWFDLSHSSFKENFLPVLSGHNVQYFGHFQDGQEYLDDFKKIYSPLIVKTEPQQSSDEAHTFFNMKKKVHMGLLGQTYSFNQTFSLLDEFQKINNTSFDLYIKLRTDLVYLNKVNLNFDDESLYTKNINNWRPASCYVNDYIFFTKKYNNMKILSEFGFGIDSILEKSEKLLYTGGPNNDLYCCEEILARYLEGKAQIKTYNFNVDLARYHK